MKLKFPILTIDRPSDYTGRVYPQAEVEKMIEKARERLDVLGVTDLYIEDGYLVAEAEDLTTDHNEMYKELKTSVGFRMAPAMNGYDDEGVAKDPSLLKFNITTLEE